MANGHGGRRLGAGRKKKIVEEGIANSNTEQSPPSLEETLQRLLTAKPIESVTTEEFKKLAYEVAYMRQELEFIKKIILVSAGVKPK